MSILPIRRFERVIRNRRFALSLTLNVRFLCFVLDPEDFGVLWKEKTV